jgi:tight adherence protein B
MVPAAFPLFYVSFKRQQRLNKLGQQLPDVLDLMSRVLRAGQTAPQALNAVADEFRDPVGTEFGLCYEQQNLGLSLDVALKQTGGPAAADGTQNHGPGDAVQRQTGQFG